MTAGPAMPVRGHVDGCRDGLIHGWAYFPDAPGERAIVELVVGGVVAGDTLANLPRGDLVGAGISDAHCGFSFACDAAFLDSWPGGSFEALVRIRDGGALSGGYLELDESALRPAARTGATVWPELIWPISGAEGFVDRFDDSGVGGWIHLPGVSAPPVTIELWEGESLAGTVIADIWRPDLAGARQGDGRWGFWAPMPGHLFDDRLHRLELRLPGGSAILPGPVYIRLPAALAAANRFAKARQHLDAPPSPMRPRPARHDAPTDLMFSFVINFYNMQREAARTLLSLTRAYQRGIGDLRYEVLCVDNGSNPPLDAGWVESFGAEFRLIRPARLHASPCAALNVAANQARGRYVAIMIDGAHMLTPGVLREVWDAVTEAPDAVVTLKHWFVGGDQRWLSENDYGTHQEDMLFDRIAWPKDGYALFTIGKPVWESPSHWLDEIGESNCLFMPAHIFTAIGGLDEAFDEAGAGFANLDLFGRAAAASPEPVVALIGEASFHQFHGGTTTNVSDAAKDERVRRYESHYAAMRGKPYRPTAITNIRVRGRLPSTAALMTRQSPLSPAKISVTDRVRPVSAKMSFDAGAQDYANAAYVEAGLHTRSVWLGKPLGVAPSDVLAIQDIIFRTRPERIVAVNLAAGLIRFIDTVIGLYEGPSCKVVTVSAAPQDDLPGSCMHVAGDPAALATLQSVERALGTVESVLVLFSPNPGDTLPDKMLRAYAGFVSPRSYLIFIGSVMSQPWLGYSKNWFDTAIRRLVESMPFAIDPSANPHLISTSPMGYLLRLGGILMATPGELADALDEI